MSETTSLPVQRETPPALPRRSRLNRRNLHGLLLALVLIVAALLRFNDLNWDQSQHFHPDERHVKNVLSMVQLPDSIGQYFDSGRSPLNPYNVPQSWVYGTLPLFFHRLLAEFLDKGCGPAANPVAQLLGYFILGITNDPNLRAAGCMPGFFTSYDLLSIGSRFVSALADLLTVFIVYLLGRRLFGWRVGLLAAAFSALCVLQIQHAHFAVVESITTLSVTLCLYFCARIVMPNLPASEARSNTRLWLNAALAGAFSGLAVASKISVWPTAVLIVIAIVVALVRDRRTTMSAVLSAGAAVLIAGVFSFAGLRVTQPYGFVGSSDIEWKYTIRDCGNMPSPQQQEICLRTFPLPDTAINIIEKLPPIVRTLVVPSSRWVAELRAAAGQSTGQEDPPWGWQWANRLPVIFPLVNILFYGLGLPLGITALIGAFFALRQWLRGRRWWAYTIPVLWTFGFFLYQGTQFVKSIRYQLPIYPMLCVLAAVLLVALWRNGWRWQGEFASRNIASRIKAWTARFALPVVLIGTLVWTLGFMRIYDGEMARVEASRWIYGNVPTAVTMQWQAGGQQRQLQLPIPDVTLRTNEMARGGLFRLDSKNDGVVAPAQNVTIRLNHVQGEGDVLARIFEYESGNTLQGVTRTVNAGDAAFVFDQVTLKPDTDYVIEFSLLQGDAVTARTSVIANQHFDESGPVRVGGRDGFGSYYRGLASTTDGTMQVYNEDTPAKLDMFLNGLDESDYLILYSNRHYGSVARLPWRFPLTNAYYTALMGGELGFELAADFSRFPQIGPFVFNDQEMPQALLRSANTQGTPPAIEVPYPTAEEAFSIYDHPRVLIFRKTPAYSRDLAQRILGVVDTSRIIRQTAFEASNTPSGLLLDQKTWAAQQAGGTWSELFPRNSPLNQSPLLAVIALVALVYVLGTAAFMLMALSTRKRDGTSALADGGYAFSKMLGLLLVAFIAWWLGSARVLPFTPAALWGIIAGLAIFAAIIGHLNRDYILALIKTRWKVMLVGEIVFLVAFVIFLLIRAGNPDLWHPFFGGEKPMDLAFFNTVLKSTWFPPQDPWFAGGAINYYYFGFVIVAAPVKALGIDPTVAYNIVIPLLFALTGLGAFGLGASFYASRISEKVSRWESEKVGESAADSDAPNLPFSPSHFLPFSVKRAAIAGVIAAIFVIGVGNGDQIRVVSPAFQDLGGVNAGTPPVFAFINGVAKWLAGAQLPLPVWYAYWNPTRPSPEVMIAEFPQFTFLYADLHAHMMAMPLALLALAFALAYAGGARRWHAILLGAIATGMLWPTNTWDYPPYMLLGVAGLALGAIAGFDVFARGRAKESASGDAHYTDTNDVVEEQGAIADESTSGDAHYTTDQISVFAVRSVVKAVLKAVPAMIAFVVLTRLAIVPYLAHYGSAYNSIDPWRGDRTQINTFITIYGLFLIPLIGHALLALFSPHNDERRLSRIALIPGLAGGVLLLLFKVPIALVAAPMALLALAAAFARRTTTQTRLMWLMTAGAWVLTIFVELFVLRGDIERMNTVFKFYLQAWMMLGIASAVALVWVFETFAERRAETQSAKRKTQNIVRAAFITVLAIAFFLAALYPAFAVPAKVNDRFVATAPRGLDGMAYMQQAICDGARCTGRDGTSFPLKDDYDAIKWMQDNVKGSPTIMEGNTSGQQYTWSNRYSIYTGLPAVLGWQWHMRQQRGALDERAIYDRDADITAFYETADADFARTFLERYDVSYVVLGPLEKAYYAGLYAPKFDALVENGTLRVAYQNAGVTLFERIR
jgi:YYY domain-containing protein